MIRLLLLLLFSSQLTMAQDTVLLWQDTLKANWLMRPESYPMMRADSTGVYLIANYSDTLQTSFDTPHKSLGKTDGLLLKYDKKGEVAWKHHFESPGEIVFGHLKKFPSRNLGLVGYNETTCQVGRDRWHEGAFGIIVSRQGDLTHISTHPIQELVFPDIEPTRSLFLTQAYDDSIHLDEKTVLFDKSKYPNSVFAEYDKKGLLRGFKKLDTIPDFYRTGAIFATGITQTRTGDIFVAGYFSDTPFLHDDHLRGFKGRDLFLVCYNKKRVHKWTIQLSSSPLDFYCYKMYYRYDHDHIVVEARSYEAGATHDLIHHRYEINMTGTEVKQELHELTQDAQHIPESVVADRIPVSEDVFYTLNIKGKALVIQKYGINFTGEVMAKEKEIEK
ncbi:MAG: hypothetical protein AAF740_01145 [Bacteroidota bacterium]